MEIKTVEQRFWDKVDKNGPVPTHRPWLGPCWIWTPSKNSGDYGKIRIDGVLVLAHRLAWEIKTGTPPGEKHILHECDNPPCVRHLFIGTQFDNMRDAAKKGRNANSKKTSCPSGHSYSRDNVRVDGHGRRVCKTCVNDRNRATYWTNLEESRFYTKLKMRRLRALRGQNEYPTV